MNTTRQKTNNAASLLTAAFLLLAFCLWRPAEVRAQQWTTNGNDINNTNTGNVGVGTGSSAPAARLDVKGGTSDATAAAASVRNSGDTNLLFVRNDGFIGFGTTAPVSLLHLVDTSVSPVRGLTVDEITTGTHSAQVGLRKARGVPGALTAVLNGDTLAGIRASAYDGTNYLNTASIQAAVNGTVATNSVPTDLYFSTGSSGAVERMRITADGYVGIGTTSPTRLLELSASGTNTLVYNSSAAALSIFNTNTTANNTADLSFRTYDSGGTAITPAKVVAVFTNRTVGASAGDLTFVTLNASTAAERMRVTGNGNVGIGNSSPSFKLDVAGQVRSSSGGFVFPDGTTQATALVYGSAAGTAVQGNTTLTVAAGTGMSGGGPVSLGAGGTLTLTNSDRGSAQNIFKNVGNAAGAAQFSAGSNTDTLSFEGTGGTTVSFDANSRKVVINSDSASSSGWTDSGASVNLTSATDRVGIGTSNPATVLHVLTSGATKPQFVLQNSTATTQIETSLAGSSVQWNYGMDQADASKFKFSTDGNGNLATGTTMTMTTGGNVGIGTTTPTAKLHVVGGAIIVQGSTAGGGNGNGDFAVRSASGNGYWDFAAQNTNGTFVVYDAINQKMPLTVEPNAPTNTMYVKSTGAVGIGTAGPGAKLDVNAGSNTAAAINATGTINATGAITGATVSATYQDVAEWVPSTQKLTSGTVVVLDGGKTNHVLASTYAYDTKVAGVISDSPGVILGVGGEDKLKVATTGRVRVRVDAARAPIRVGDLLVTSDVEGVAMKSVEIDLGGVKIHRPGTIIGKALEPLEKGTGEILVLLSLQ